MTTKRKTPDDEIATKGYVKCMTKTVWNYEHDPNKPDVTFVFTICMWFLLMVMFWSSHFSDTKVTISTDLLFSIFIIALGLTAILFDKYNNTNDEDSKCFEIYEEPPKKGC